MTDKIKDKINIEEYSKKGNVKDKIPLEELIKQKGDKKTKLRK